MKHLLIFLLATLQVAPGSAAVISEPDTVFYGKVLVPVGSRHHQLYAGRLAVTLTPEAGPSVHLETQLKSLANGEFSYRLAVPHEAVSAGLSNSSGVIPLPSTTSLSSSFAATLDDARVSVAPAAESLFSAAQEDRAGLVAIDLIVTGDLPDTDQDGLPDWWEDRHGLNPQLASDATSNLDGDLLDATGEFLAGTDPNVADSDPRILTDRLLVFSGRRTGILLNVFDPSGESSELVMRVTSLPTSGQLELDGTAVTPDTPIAPDAMSSGQLVFVHDPDTPDDAALSMTIALADATAGTDYGATEIELQLYAPNPLNTPELLEPDARNRRLLFNSTGADTVLWDFSARSSLPELTFASASPQAILGSGGSDRIATDEGSDFLLLGPGQDVIRGGGGADRFSIAESAAWSHQEISDFSADTDTLDLQAVFRDTSGSAADFLTLLPEALLVDPDATGPQDPFTISLPGNAFLASDLNDLLTNGRILVGGLTVPTAVSAVATIAETGETQPDPGLVIISRTGPTDLPLAVRLVIGGTATNGTDYSLVDSRVTIPAGSREVAITIVPFRDSLQEGTEIAEISILSSPDYILSSQHSTQVLITDARPLLSIESPVAKGSVSPPSEAVLVIRRSGDTNTSLLAQLDVAGSARPGTDYPALTPFLVFDAGETFKLISIQPTDNATFDDALRSVKVSLRADPGFDLGSSSSAEVVLIRQPLTYAEWLADNQQEDHGGNRISYAFSGGFKPRLSEVDGRLRIRLRGNVAASDLSFRAEFSRDLARWSQDEEVVRVISSPAASPGIWSFETVQPIGDEPDLFIRIVPQLP